MLFQHVAGVGKLHLDYAKKLVADIPDEKMCVQPLPGMNHAAWVLGHVAFVFDSMARVFDLPPSMSKEWVDLFKPSSQPSTDRAMYPSKAALLETYEKNYHRLLEVVQTATPEFLDREFPNPRLRPLLPTIGVAMVHVLTSHQAVHLGQLSAWRRAQGMGGVLM